MVGKVLAYSILVLLVIVVVTLIYDSYAYQKRMRHQMERIAKFNKILDEARHEPLGSLFEFDPGNWISNNEPGDFGKRIVILEADRGRDK